MGRQWFHAREWASWRRVTLLASPEGVSWSGKGGLDASVSPVEDISVQFRSWGLWRLPVLSVRLTDGSEGLFVVPTRFGTLPPDRAVDLAADLRAAVCPIATPSGGAARPSTHPTGRATHSSTK